MIVKNNKNRRKMRKKKNKKDEEEEDEDKKNHGDLLSMAHIKVALRTYLNIQSFYSVDEFLMCKDNPY